MDLIASLADQLGVPAAQAEAVAGGVLSFVRGKVGEQDAGAAEAFDEAVPELSAWSEAAAAQAATPKAADALSGLMGAATSSGLLGAVGGAQAQEAAVLVQLLGKLGVEPGQAKVVAPLLWSFLEDRLPPEVRGLVAKVAPFLGGGGPSAGLGGMIGGLFG